MPTTDDSRSAHPPAYQLRPLAVSSDFRTTVLAAYPALIDGAHCDDLAYRRIMQYLLTSTFVDGEGRLILPYATVAVLVGVSTKAHGFAAGDWIKRFSQDVLPLHASDYCRLSGQARVIAPDLDPALRAALAADRERSAEAGSVWFDTGEYVSRRGKRAARAEHERFLIKQSRASVDAHHPARPLVEFLLHQPQDCLQRVLTRNWPSVRALALSLPDVTERERVARDWCLRLMRQLEDFCNLYYAGSPHTPRISAIGANIHQLPRALRHVALAGAWECDLRAAQLAVVARLWEIPELQAFLEAQEESGHSIWQELLGWIGRPVADKPLVKSTLYSIIFGMSKAHLKERLKDGDMDTAGFGQEVAERFFEHPLMTALLLARGREQRKVWIANGASDAWGNWKPTTWDAAAGKKNVPSVLSYVVQSHELRLMLSVLPVIEAEPQMYLLSWLHDGVTVWLGNTTKAERQIRKLQEAVRREATTKGFATCLEVERLSNTTAEVNRAK